MAHEVETMAYSGTIPWHGLGVPVEADLTPFQMLRAAKLNWKVEKVQAYCENPKTKRHEPIGKMGLYRTSDGKLLDEVSPDWEPVQNTEAFEFFQEWCEEGKINMETAGSLRGGQYVWALARINESFDVVKGDRVDNFLLFVNPHKYGSSIQVGMNPIRVVCMNTLRLSLNKNNTANMVTLQHRKKFDAEEVKETMIVAHDKFMRYKEVAQFLASRRYDQEKVKEYFTQIFPITGPSRAAGAVVNDNFVARRDISKHAKTALEVLEAQPGTGYAEGTWWQAVNAVTYMTDHILSKSADTRLFNAWIGTEKDRKLKAMELATDYAEAA
jgi:phage/plasmid-like protein (TIGR03299 family)